MLFRRTRITVREQTLPSKRRTVMAVLQWLPNLAAHVALTVVVNETVF